MNEVVKFLNENPVQYLATVGRDGKAKCRPFMFAGEKDGKLWFSPVRKTASCGSAPTIRKMSIRICRPTPMWRFPCPALRMPGFV